MRRDAVSHHRKAIIDFAVRISNDNETLIYTCLFEPKQVKKINKNNKCIRSFTYHCHLVKFIELIHHFYYQRKNIKAVPYFFSQHQKEKKKKIMIIFKIKVTLSCHRITVKSLLIWKPIIPLAPLSAIWWVIFSFHYLSTTWLLFSITTWS